ncbi:MAG: hypothetical protein P3T54_02795 [Dehalogenimonas sp.]|uniref:Uncharacterized protein n=1 Tax=Candidatus Dehalogenimonas loeffleri TaxID=3127115 RepID=A0ABZ2J6M7_9CHLR|nr:hypothetical protein [Dehalogenimonas sp.]
MFVLTEPSGKYAVYLEKNAVLKGWRQLESQYPEPMKRCKAFLEKSPADTINSAGKAKRLKGELKWLLQYDVTDSHRIRYWINQEARSV